MSGDAGPERIDEKIRPQHTLGQPAFAVKMGGGGSVEAAYLISPKLLGRSDPMERRASQRPEDRIAAKAPVRSVPMNIGAVGMQWKGAHAAQEG